MYILCHLFTARKRSLGQGNVFTPVCQSFCSQGGLHPAGSASGVVGLHSESATRGWADPPSHQILWDMVNEWAVRILLECTLVEIRTKWELDENEMMKNLFNFSTVFIIYHPSSLNCTISSSDEIRENWAAGQRSCSHREKPRAKAKAVKQRMTNLKVTFSLSLLLLMCVNGA